MKKIPITYKRDKDKVEISGEPADVKPMIWYDLITSSRPRFLIRLILFFRTSFIITLPMIWQWLKSKLPFLIILPVLVSFLLMLSG